MRCQTSPNDVGQLVRDAREHLGLSQRRLAVRAGTSQDAISRIERGIEAPTIERLSRILLVLGSRLSLDVEPLERGAPRSELAATAATDPGERLREAAGWNRLASGLAAAGERARSEDHPATVRRDR